MANPTLLQRSLFRAQGCVYDIQALSDVQKAVLVMAVTLTAITLLTAALLSHLDIIQGLNTTAQNGLLAGGTTVVAFSLTTFVIYQCRKASNPFPNGKVVNMGVFTTAEDPECKKIQSYSKHLMLQAYHVTENGKAAPHLFRFLNNPKENLIATECCIAGNNVWLFPRLNECSCCNSGNFNRFFNTRRQQLEDKMVSDVTTQFPPATSDCIRYLGLGAGGLLQDFINVGKLIRAGYQQIDVVLVDPKFVGSERKKEEQEQFEFLKIVAKELAITLNISYHRSQDEVEGDFHIISAIDFDDFMENAFSDAIKLHSRIKEGGRYYIAFDIHDLIFDHNGLIETFIHEKLPNEFNQLLESLKTTVQGRRQIHVTFVEDKTRILQWVYCLRALTQDRKIEKIVINLPSPHKTHGALDKLNPAMDEESLRLFFSLLTPSAKVEIQLFQTFEELKAISQDQDVIIWLEGANVQNKIEPQIKWMRDNHPEAIQYYGCAGFDESDKKNPVWSGFWRWASDSSIHFFSPLHHSKIASLMSVV